MDIKRIDEGLYRLYVPFEELMTAVFFAVYPQGTVIVDSATYASDAENYIVVALDELGIERESVKYIALTHGHGDHAGGAGRLSELLPMAEVRSPEPVAISGYSQIGDGELLLGGLRAIRLAGHTKNCVGYLDERSGTLLSGDCLQLRGVGKYTNGVRYPDTYRASIERVRGMKLRRIVASHEYVPLGSIAEGERAIKEYLDTCIEVL